MKYKCAIEVGSRGVLFIARDATVPLGIATHKKTPKIFSCANNYPGLGGSLLLVRQSHPKRSEWHMCLAH